MNQVEQQSKYSIVSQKGSKSFSQAVSNQNKLLRKKSTSIDLRVDTVQTPSDNKSSPVNNQSRESQNNAQAYFAANQTNNQGNLNRL